VTIFDLSGRKVTTLARGTHAAGEHVVSWNAAETASGIYFARLETAATLLTRKLLLIK
jgi:hypothetical protein